MKSEPKGSQAARLRQRKFELLRTLSIPPDALPASLSKHYRKCGKPTCRCASGEGHPLWQLTFMVNGKKRVEQIPHDWVEEIQRRVDEGRRFKDAVGEVFASNAQLVALSRRQRNR